MNLGRFIIYIVIGIGVFIFNLMNLTYVPMILDIIYIALSVFLVVTGLILRQRASIEVINRKENATCKEPFELLVRITNRARLPLTGAKFVLEFTHRQTKKKTRQVCQIACSAQSEYTATIPIRVDHCECIGYRIKKVYVYDFLRLFRFARRVHIEDELLVLPKLPSVELLSKMTISLAEDENVVYSMNRPGDDPGQIFVIREYEGGDKLRNIHWKLSTKCNELMVKDYSLPLYEKDTILFDWYDCKDKKHMLHDEVYSLLFGLIYTMTARGYGLQIGYMNQEYVQTRIATEHDLNAVFATIYEASTIHKSEESAAVHYYGLRDAGQNRVFYVTNQLNEMVTNHMELLQEAGPVYYLIPGHVNENRLPVLFTGEKLDA